MRPSIVSIVVLGLAASANAQTNAPEGPRWLCVADASTGFSFDADAKRWRPTHFRTDEKWIIRRPSAVEKAEWRSPEWVIAQPGRSRPTGSCASDFRDDELNCTALLGSLTFSRKTLRYIRAADFGYVAPIGAEGGDSPYMEIGRCSAF